MGKKQYNTNTKMLSIIVLIACIGSSLTRYHSSIMVTAFQSNMDVTILSSSKARFSSTGNCQGLRCPMHIAHSAKDDDADSEVFQGFRNRNNIHDQVFSAMSKDGAVKVTTCTARNLLNDLMIQNTMTEVPSEALGRTIICALLMSNGMESEQTVQITLNANGPLRGVVGISKGNGEVRGFVGSPMLGDVPLTEAVGKGFVQVVKMHPDWPTPYNGITAIRHGDVDRDVGIYLAESEQRSCALAAATSITGILCKAAGGYLIEQLPDADEETIARVEKNLVKLVELNGSDNSLPTQLLLNGVDPYAIAETILEGLDMQPLQQLEPKLACECTDERLVRSLRLLPREEVEDILKKEDKIEARCQFCGKVYSMGPDEIRERLETASGDPSQES